MRLISFCFSLLLGIVKAQDYELGECPKVEPVPDFDITRFSGLWYVMEKFDETSPCWTYYFHITNTTFKVYQSQNQLVDPKNLDKLKGPAGELEIPNATNPGQMRVRFSDNIIGKSEFIVFFTDYDNYGAIFSCQKVLFGHRRSAVILSRRPSIDLSLINRSRAKLVPYKIDLKPFKSVDQSKCVYTPSAPKELSIISPLGYPLGLISNFNHSAQFFTN